MPIRAETYAFARQAPYLVEQAYAQTIAAPIRHGITGGLVVPASGTITITDPDGTELVSATAVTVTGSQATYEWTTTTATDLGGGYTTIWALTMPDGEPYTFRQSAFVMEYVPRNVVDATAIYRRIPELRHRIPPSQAASGDNTGWQPQIDDAYFEMVNWMLENGKPPWKVREITGYRAYLLARSVQLCVGTVRADEGSEFAQHAKNVAFEVRGARATMRLQYDTKPATTRTAAAPVTRTVPPGRPLW